MSQVVGPIEFAAVWQSNCPPGLGPTGAVDVGRSSACGIKYGRTGDVLEFILPNYCAVLIYLKDFAAATRWSEVKVGDEHGRQSECTEVIAVLHRSMARRAAFARS